MPYICPFTLRIFIFALHIGTVSYSPNSRCCNFDDPILEKVTDQGVAVF